MQPTGLFADSELVERADPRTSLATETPGNDRDQLILVGAWLGRVPDVLRLSAAGEQGKPCSSVLSQMGLWGRLRRAHPLFLNRFAGGCRWVRLLERQIDLSPLPAAQLHQVIAVRSAGWLKRARLLPRVPADSPDLPHLTVALLDELDELELAGVAGSELRGMQHVNHPCLRNCLAWLCRHVDLFLSAASFVRASLGTMHPDLPITQPVLAQTARKFLRVLEAVEEMEDELGTTDPEVCEASPIFPSTVR